MGQAKLRGTFDERKSEAINAGRSLKKLKDRRAAAKLAEQKQRLLVAEAVARIIYGQNR